MDDQVLDQRRDMIQKLVEYMDDYDFPGVSTEPETVQWFAESFCEFHEKLFHTYMRLEAYHCPVVKKPANIGGYIWMPKKMDSNKVYQSIGCVEVGRITDIKFDLCP